MHGENLKLKKSVEGNSKIFVPLLWHFWKLVYALVYWMLGG